jgi:hypothetical protein
MFFDNSNYSNLPRLGKEGIFSGLVVSKSDFSTDARVYISITGVATLPLALCFTSAFPTGGEAKAFS